MLRLAKPAENGWKVSRNPLGYLPKTGFSVRRGLLNVGMLKEEAGWATRDPGRVEAHPCVRASELRRVGVLSPHHTDDDFWAAVPYCEGVEAVYNAERRELSLYAQGFPDTVVAVTWTECRFGGVRPWLLCGVCGSRRLNLHRVGERWACRECHGLRYECQRRKPADRAKLRADRIRLRYNSSDFRALGGLPTKPLHMHLKRYYLDQVKLHKADIDSVRPVSQELDAWYEAYEAKIKELFPPRRARRPRPDRPASPASNLVPAEDVKLAGRV
jgi:hypothetical protein